MREWVRGLPGVWAFTRVVTHEDGTVFPAVFPAVFEAVGEARFEPGAVYAGEGADIAGVELAGGGLAGGGLAGAQDGARPLRWRESGELREHGGGYATSFERELRLVPRGDTWWVQFADGRDFHPVLHGDFLHECGRDTYSGNLEIRPDSSFRLTWHVSGPAKRYHMVTEYRRAD